LHGVQKRPRRRQSPLAFCDSFRARDVVVYSSLPCAYRESFIFRKLPVEAFVHNPETLEYFSVEMDRAAGIPALPQMVVEGREIPNSTDLSRMLKARAAALH
jgi:hypothetical protein